MIELENLGKITTVMFPAIIMRAIKLLIAIKHFDSTSEVIRQAIRSLLKEKNHSHEIADIKLLNQKNHEAIRIEDENLIELDNEYKKIKLRFNISIPTKRKLANCPFKICSFYLYKLNELDNDRSRIIRYAMLKYLIFELKLMNEMQTNDIQEVSD